MKTPGVLLALSIVGASACQNEKKPPPRTEPWPARPASASSAPGTQGSRLSYVIDKSLLRIELPARQKKPRGTLSEVTGTIDWDSERPEQVRAEIRVDLLSLSLGFDDTAEPELLARAFDWLELSQVRSPEERERDRYAVLRISSCDRGVSPDDSRERGPASCTARGDLTLHRFRVPVAVDVAVEVEKDAAGAPGALVIRTRRPLVVSLARYDIQPRSRQGELLATELSSLGSEIGREARIAAELRARPSITSAPKNP